MSMYVWRLEVGMRHLSQLLPTLYFASLARDFPVSASPLLGFQVCCPLQPFYIAAGDQTQDLKLVQQTLYQPRHLARPLIGERFPLKRWQLLPGGLCGCTRLDSGVTAA